MLSANEDNSIFDSNKPWSIDTRLYQDELTNKFQQMHTTLTPLLKAEELVSVIIFRYKQITAKGEYNDLLNHSL